MYGAGTGGGEGCGVGPAALRAKYLRRGAWCHRTSKTFAAVPAVLTPPLSAPACVATTARQNKMLTRLFGVVPFRALYEYPAQDANVYAGEGMLASSSASYVCGPPALAAAGLCLCLCARARVCVCVCVCARARYAAGEPSFLGVSVSDCLCACWRSDMMMEVAEPFTTPWA